MKNSREKIFNILRSIIPYPDIVETYIIEVSNLTSISLDETHHIIPRCLGGTDESKKKMSESHLGKHHSEETKLKISRNLPDRHGSNNPMYGFKACWINNGLINKRIRVEDMFLYPDWSKGRLPNRSKEGLILEE